MIDDSAFSCGKLLCACRLVAWIWLNKARPLNNDRSREEMIA